MKYKYHYKPLASSFKLSFKFSLLIVVLTACILNRSQAQTYGDEFSSSDSLDQTGDSVFVKEKKLPTYTVGDGMKQYTIDTSLGKYYYDPVFENYDYRNTGNLGNAHLPVNFLGARKHSLLLGYDQFDLYKLSVDRIRFYYNHTLPYSNLFFLIGLRQQHAFNVTHSQNIKKRFNFGFHYRRIASEGDYTNQETKHNDVGITTRYRSENQKYGFKTILIFNNINTDENGGVRDFNVFEEDTSFVDNELQGTELDEAKNKHIQADFVLKQDWSLGETVIEHIDDTTTEKHFFPTLTFFLDAGVGRDKYRYRDENPDSSYYGIFYPQGDSTGSPLVRHYLKSRELMGQFGIRKTFIESMDSTHVVYRNLVVEARSKYAYNRIEQDPSELDFPSYLDARVSVHSYPDTGNKLIYDFSAAYSFLDYNRSDLLLEGKVGYDFNKLGIVKAFTSLQRQEPAWAFQSFTMNDFSWKNSFDQTEIFSVGGTYQIPRFRFHVTAKFNNIRNMTYWDEQRLPVQHDGNLQVLNIEVRKLFRIKYFGWDNLIRLNVLSDKQLMRYPLYWSKHSLFFEKAIFKGNLLSRLGINISYNTDYFAYGYFPLTGQFHLQDEQKLHFYPVLDLFFYFKIKTLRLFLTVRHIDQGLFKQSGYFNAFKYPALDRTFNVGISWRFYD